MYSANSCFSFYRDRVGCVLILVCSPSSVSSSFFRSVSSVLDDKRKSSPVVKENQLPHCHQHGQLVDIIIRVHTYCIGSAGGKRGGPPFHAYMNVLFIFPFGLLFESKMCIIYLRTRYPSSLMNYLFVANMAHSFLFMFL